MKKIIAALLFAAVAVSAADRPATPSAQTLASPTSQIAAWYRYASDLELEIVALKKEIERMGRQQWVHAYEATNPVMMLYVINHTQARVEALEKLLNVSPPPPPPAP